MTLDAFVGNYTHPAGTGALSVGGVGFQPKALFSLSSWATALDVNDNNAAIGLGIVSGVSEQFAISGASSDADSFQDGFCGFDEAQLIHVSAASASATNWPLRSYLTSFDPSGFSLNYTDNDNGSRIGSYLALGGSTLQAKVVRFSITTGFTGDLDITTVGFQPTVVILLGSFPEGIVIPSGSSPADLDVMIGAFDENGNQWVYNWYTRDLAATSDTKRYFSNANCIRSYIHTGTGGSGTQDILASFVTMLPNGFRINVSDGTVYGSDRFYGALCLAGVEAQVGTFTRTTTAPPFTSTISTPGINPKAVVMVGSLQSVAGETDNGICGISVYGENSQGRSVSFYDQDNLGTSNCLRRSSSGVTGLLVNFDGSILQEGNTILGTEQFQVEWSVADGSFPSIQGYIALGDAPAAVEVRISQYVVEAITQPDGITLPNIRLSQYVLEAITQSGTPVVVPGQPCAPTSSIQQTYPPCYGAEFDTYIAPDGHEYSFNVKGLRYLMTEEGFGMPPIAYVTSSGPYQHGETLRDWFLQPRIIQLMISNASNSRQEYTRQRALLLDAIRPNRQVNDHEREPGVLRKRLSDGSLRDLKVVIESGPGFAPRDLARWDEYRFQEVLRFIAHDPVLFNPSQQCRSFLASGGGSPGSGGGTQLIFPITFPILLGIGTTSSGSGSSGGLSGTLQYNGTWEEYPTIVIHGPITSPVIENTTTGERLALETDIAEGESVTFELTYAIKTVTRNDGTNMLGYLSDDSDLATFHLSTINNGANQIVISGSGTSSDMFVEFFYYERFIGR